MNKQYQLVSCTINGKKVEKMVDVRASLTDFLRDDYRRLSTKQPYSAVSVRPVSL